MMENPNIGPPEKHTRFIVYSDKEEVMYRAIIDVAYKMGGRALVDIINRYDTGRSLVPNLSPMVEHLEILDPGVMGVIFERAHQFEGIDTFDPQKNFIDPDGFAWVEKTTQDTD